jgi:Common central domain of tyrosinase
MAKSTSGGKPGVNRRGFLYAAGATAIGVAGWEAGRRPDAAAGGVRADATAVAHHDHATVDPGAFRYPQGDPAYGQRGGRRPQSVHKNAARMSRQEIRRFSRAYKWAVAKGYFDVFNDQHFNARRNRHHGLEALAVSPPAVAPGESLAWGLRLLPWHRSFITEAEAMLKAALAERNRRERRDPAEADLLFLPYWDATHDRDLPGWVKRLRPRGGTAIVPEGLPPGHAGFGKPVGSRYRIDFNRWPGTWLGWQQLPPPDQIGRILSHDAFVDLYLPIDAFPEIVEERVPAAMQALAALAQRLPDNPDVQLIVAFLETPPPAEDIEAQLAAVNAFLAVGHLANLEAAKPRPDRELIRLILTMYSAAVFPPHITLHFWAGGLNPRNPNVRGTVTYFNELAVDPVFWMLHGELDRIWYTWETTHTDVPQLEGADRVFQPLRREEGRWYGGGRTYTIDQLVDHQAMAYTYDRLYTV